MAKFCVNCGSPLEPDVKFCKNCGAPVEQTDEKNAAPKPQPAPQAPQMQTQQAPYQMPQGQYRPQTGYQRVSQQRQTPQYRPPMPTYQQPQGQYRPQQMPYQQQFRPQTPPQYRPPMPQQMPQQKGGHGGCLTIIIICVLILIGSVLYMGFRDGGWFRPGGWFGKTETVKTVAANYIGSM